jgi:hypothetical protein
MSETRKKVDITMCEGNVRAWIEQESIHFKAVDTFGDPVEMTGNEAEILAQQLLCLAAKIKE